MKALCLAGRIILENGGETYRAEDTVRRMARALGLSEADAFAIPSGLFISFTDENGEPKTSLNRVYLRGTHLARVDRVNQISRMLTDGLIDPDELCLTSRICLDNLARFAKGEPLKFVMTPERYKLST